MRRALPILVAFALLTAPSFAQTTRPAAKPLEVSQRIDAGDGVTVARLENGLTVIIKPMRTAPVVDVRAAVRAGGLYEGKWLGCGISHLTEHLVAKGAVHDMGSATAAEAKQTSDRVSEIGGQSNAYTSLARTVYYISATAGKAEDCIDLVADWMARPEITKEDFQREHGVVQRELEKGKDEPDRQMWYMAARNLFGDHPASVPVIGHAAPLAALTYQDVLDYHKLMYVPQNMVFTVVGDVDADKVLARVRRAFAGFQPGRLPSLDLPEVRPFSGVRRVSATHPALKETMVSISFQTIPLIHRDLYALDVLSYVLTRGDSSRMVRALEREQKLVTSVGSSSWTPAWGKGVFDIDYRCEPANADAAEKAILAELRQVISEGVTEAELDRAKRQKIADFVYGQQTVGSVAGTLSSDYLSTGDVHFSRDYTRRIQAVTAGQVRAAAKKYFDFDAMAITRLTPPKPQAAGDEVRPTTQPAAAEEDAATLHKLPNGLRVILHPTKDVELVSMTLVTRGGVLAETDKTNGLGSLMAELATKGAAGRSAEQIAEFFDRAGGSLSGSSGNNTFYWQATVLDDRFAEALEILGDVVARPTFSEKELEILRPKALAAVRNSEEHWFARGQKLFRETFFIDSPYRRLPVGTEEVVKNATVEQIAEFHKQHVLAGSSVLAIYGNFDAAEARRIVAEHFDLPKGEVPRPQVAPRRLNEPVLETKRADIQQAVVFVGAPGMTIDNEKDKYAITVLDTIISGYNLPSGWLHEQLRGKQLVYVVHAYNWTGEAPGAFLTYAACQPEQARQVVDIIHGVYRKAAEYTPTRKEIDEAVNIILTAELLGNQTMSSLAMQSALDELYGLGHDAQSRLEQAYRAVTPQDVRRVAGKYLAAPLVTTVVTPAPDAVKPAK